ICVRPLESSRWLGEGQIGLPCCVHRTLYLVVYSPPPFAITARRFDLRRVLSPLRRGESLVSALASSLRRNAAFDHRPRSARRGFVELPQRRQPRFGKPRPLRSPEMVKAAGVWHHTRSGLAPVAEELICRQTENWLRSQRCLSGRCCAHQSCARKTPDSGVRP